MDKKSDKARVAIVIIDDSVKQEFTLEPGERLLIGRHEPASKNLRATLSEAMSTTRVRQYRSRSLDVSEHHAEIRVTEDGRPYVKDLGSTNGTLARLPAYQDLELRPNTEVLCGRSLLVQLRTPLWESIDDDGRFERPEDFAAHVQTRLQDYGVEAEILRVDGNESRKLRGLHTRLPLPGHQSYLVVTWRTATFNLELERWVQMRVLMFNSGSLCVPIGSHDRVAWRFTAASPERQSVLKAARRVAATDGTVLLCGSTGVGKDVLAHDIHNHSGRAAGPFIAYNCAALPANIAESELFGSEKGAYTDAQARPGLFEQAHGGTLFLDEIGELPLELQAKLLRVLEDKRIRRLGSTTDRSVNVRLIAATNKSLPTMVSSQAFRADLWFRLEGVQLIIPDLRAEDVRVLTYHLYEEVRKEENLVEIANDELDQLALFAAHKEWKGNARQIRGALRRYLTHREETLSVEENWQAAMAMSPEVQSGTPPVPPSPPVSVAGDDGDELPKNLMSVVGHIDRLLTLTVMHGVLFPYRWGAWAELGRQLDLTGAGAQEKSRRLGFSTDPPPEAVKVEQAIEETRSALQPFLGFLRKTLRL